MYLNWIKITERCIFIVLVFIFILKTFGEMTLLILRFYRAADGIKIINQLNDDVFTTVIKYVHKNMSLSGENANADTEDNGLEK